MGRALLEIASSLCFISYLSRYVIKPELLNHCSCMHHITCTDLILWHNLFFVLILRLKCPVHQKSAAVLFALAQFNEAGVRCADGLDPAESYGRIAREYGG